MYGYTPIWEFVGPMPEDQFFPPAERKVLCPGMDEDDFCDCESDGDCAGPDEEEDGQDLCACAEAQACCNGPPDFSRRNLRFGNTGYGAGCCFPFFTPGGPIGPGPDTFPDKRMLTAGMPSFEEYRKSHD